jgi:hypothetical protein
MNLKLQEESFDNFALKDMVECFKINKWKAEGILNKESTEPVPRHIPVKDLKYLSEEDLNDNIEKITEKFDELSGMKCHGDLFPRIKIEKLPKTIWGRYNHRFGRVQINEELCIDKFSETLTHELYHSRQPKSLKIAEKGKPFRDIFLNEREILARAHAEALGPYIKEVLVEIYLRNQTKEMFEQSENAYV